MQGANQATEPRSLHLAMVLFRYFPWGGMQRNFMRIARACVERGHRVDVYTMDWEGECPEGLNVELVKVAGHSNIIRYRRFIKQIEQRIPALNYSLVMGFNRMPGLDLYYAADPCFVERIRLTRPWYYPLTARYRHFRGIEKRVFEVGTKPHILALSARQIEDYSKYYSTPRNRFTLLPPAVQPAYCRTEDALSLRAAFREQYGIGVSDPVFLMIGSGFSRKGIDRGIRAVAALSAAIRENGHLFVVGQGREKPMQSLAQRLGVNLRIIGGSDELPLFMQGADLLMHPARSENTGNVIVEAIAAGLPVLCSGTCGYADHVVQADAGQVLPEPFDQVAMNELLAEMMDEQKLKTWQQHALEYAASTDLYSRLDRALEVIETLAAKRPPHA